MNERAHQIKLINWFEINFSDYSRWLFAVPNGGIRNKITASILKKEGVRKGVPDLFLPIPSSGYSGLFIELKSEKGRVSKEQGEWIEFLNSVGYKAVICKGWVSAAESIKDYMADISAPKFDL